MSVTSQARLTCDYNRNLRLLTTRRVDLRSSTLRVEPPFPRELPSAIPGEMG